MCSKSQNIYEGLLGKFRSDDEEPIAGEQLECAHKSGVVIRLEVNMSTWFFNFGEEIKLVVTELFNAERKSSIGRDTYMATSFPITLMYLLFVSL